MSDKFDIIASKAGKILEHPFAMIGGGTGLTAGGMWLYIQRATSIAALVAALCGAVTGVVGVYLLYRKWKRGTLFKDE